MPASVNTLTEAVMLQCPPRLMLINGGGYFTMPTSVNVLTEAVAGPAALPRITEAGNRAIRLRGHFENAAQKIFV